MLNLFIGYDDREAIVFHTCVESIIKNSSIPFKITPLALNNLRSIYKENHNDGSNDFIYSRFLVPYLSNYQGKSLYLDGDMVVKGDLAELESFCLGESAIAVAKHEYKTKYPVKYFGNKNEDYPRKNWSSVIMYDCAHPALKRLTPDFVAESTGKCLHRFEWLDDNLIKSLPLDWNHLVLEYPSSNSAKLLHYTLGAPNFTHYRELDHSDDWLRYYKSLNNGME